MAKENDVKSQFCDTDLPILALSDGRAGNVAMAEGLAAALAARIGTVWRRHDLVVSGALPAWVWGALPASFALRGAEIPSAGIVVGAGRRVAPIVAALERMGTARGVQVMNSGIAPNRFAAVVAPAHDDLAGTNVISTLGSVNRITGDTLAAARGEWAQIFEVMPRPRVAVLLGGATKRKAVEAAQIDRLAADLTALSGSLLVTASRRTGAANIARLRAALPDAWFWDETGANPYMGMLAWADAIIVSDDSVNMASEAASTPAPVAIWPLLSEGGKTARFHKALYTAEVAEPFTGRLPERSTPPLIETARAADAVLEVLLGGRTDPTWSRNTLDSR